MVLFTNTQEIVDQVIAHPLVMIARDGAMEPSIGVRYLLVQGTVVVDQGKIVRNVFPGRALRGPGRRL